jgi:DNA-directed RNA polymerase specialized sigma24 family protein
MEHDDVSDIIATVGEAAENGAKIVAYGHDDVIEEVKAEVLLRWKRRTAIGNPPFDPQSWAFICGKHHALRIVRDGRRFIELSEAIADTLTGPSEEALLIEKIECPPIGWLRAGEAIEAVNTLIRITTQIIEQRGDEIDLRILDLHYKRHWTFTKIAAELGITDDAARRRWSRLMWEIIDDVIRIVRKDRKLAATFSAILEDRDDFRSCILRLLSIVAAKGISAIETAIDSILPA